MGPSPEELSVENEFVLAAVQALLGAVNPKMLAISVEVRSSTSVSFHFALARHSQCEVLAIEDFRFELLALMVGSSIARDHEGGPTAWFEEVDIETRVWIGQRPWDGNWPGSDRRLIFSAASENDIDSDE